MDHNARDEARTDGRTPGSGGRSRRRVRRRVLAAAAALCALLGPGCTPEPATSPGPGAAATAQAEPSRCRRTVVGVAHPDDDLFFLNPEIDRTIRAGCPVHTVYLTAGDGDIQDRLKALEHVDGREYGVRAAYAFMAGADDDWKQSDVRAGDVRVRSFVLAGRSPDSEVRLSFLGLHDGLPHGQEADSVLRLFDGSRHSVRGFLGGEGYTERRLLDTVSALVRHGRAERVLTMDHDNASFAFGLGGGVDHSDHGITARYFRRVGYALGVPVTSYLGYRMSALDANLAPARAAAKERVARWYVARRRCRVTGGCAEAPPYRGPLQEDWKLWVHRQYERVHRSPGPGEILGDIGRTTYAAGPDPAQCLDAAGGSSGTREVRLHACDGSPAQRWRTRADGTIGLRQDPDSCLTAAGEGAVLEPCRAGRADQRWTRVPWWNPTWKRTAWRIEGADHRCLYQDDRELPARWNDRDRPSPRLIRADCVPPARPEQYWRFGE
ncbi:ricin-type beta-trefoil lectin domain protein [Streptomyces sp. PTD5-9]|uniref:ricin-type beta-trefoil lectin domain protein n=1 Tax=Streptomyces sp. PTD5-9 TaxID=3120150 RepID=UPI003008C5CC